MPTPTIDWLAGLWPFLIAALALNLTPGADMTYVIARSATRGSASGIAASFGVAAGSFVHTVLAAFGVSAILTHSAGAFVAVKVAGAAYLLFLAWKMLSSRQRVPDPSLAPKPASHLRVFAEGMLTNLLNPKVALFILAFLPQFVEPGAGPAWIQILFLGTLFNIGGTSVNCAVALSAAAATNVLQGKAGLGRWLDRLSALVFVGLAIRLAFAERR